jgi:hypothetical protein
MKMSEERAQYGAPSKTHEPMTEADLAELEVLVWGGDGEDISDDEADLIFVQIPRLIAEVRRLRRVAGIVD